MTRTFGFWARNTFVIRFHHPEQQNQTHNG